MRSPLEGKDEGICFNVANPYNVDIEIKLSRAVAKILGIVSPARPPSYPDGADKTSFSIRSQPGFSVFVFLLNFIYIKIIDVPYHDRSVFRQTFKTPERRH
jgi:hypothetical protein